MEQHMKEVDILKEVLDTNRPSKFAEDLDKLAVVDAFTQFSQNPTSATAGFGVEQNYPFISQNLSKRYAFGRTRAETIVTFVKDSFERMKQTNYDVYFWREAIRDYIREKFMEEFHRWYDSLYKNLEEIEKRKFLFLLYALSVTSSTNELHKWFTCFFDKEETSPETELKDMAIKLGLGNILYYRSSGGYEESQFILYSFLDQLSKRFEKETFVEDRCIEEFFESLTLDNMKLLEKCLKETVPVVECRLGRVTQTATYYIDEVICPE